MNKGGEIRRLSVLHTGLCVISVALALCSVTTRTYAEQFTINTLVGTFVVDVPHLSPQGALVSPAAPIPMAFRPPTIVSAPLPSGSGARALGLAGAFTAVADDATAASWNPSGLIQLESAEASIVLRSSWEEQNHRSRSDDLHVGENDFENAALNYLSLVLPFRRFNRNFVFSLNYQEFYDFEQYFTADFLDDSSRTGSDFGTTTETETTTDTYSTEEYTIDLTSTITTDTRSYLSQTLQSDLLSSLEFEQDGVIDGITPALAMEISPVLAVGAALNFYHNNLLRGGPIESRSKAVYSGMSDSDVRTLTEQTTSGDYYYDGAIHVPGRDGFPGFDIPIPRTEGTYDEFTDTITSFASERLDFDGEYRENSEFVDLHGINATFGALWTVSRILSIGFSVDLPWTASAEQKKEVTSTVTTYNDDRSRILQVTDTSTTESKNVEFRFPLHWALGSVFRFSDQCYLSLDVSQTLWSDFYFKAEGDSRINPLDGTPYSDGGIDDTWSIRSGLEYLLVYPNTEIPLRAGIAWEQRPAIGRPDEFWHFSLGSGISIGKAPSRFILDIAYVYSRGENVLENLVAGADMTTDVEEHQAFVSGIVHF